MRAPPRSRTSPASCSPRPINAKPTLVAYRGTGPALNDLMANTVDFMTDQIVNVAPQIQGGNIKAFAIATPERSPALPNVPTTKEAGLGDYEVSAWNAVFAPKGTPPEVDGEAQRRPRQGARRRDHAQAPARPRRRHPRQGRPRRRAAADARREPRSPAGPRSSRPPAPPGSSARRRGGGRGGPPPRPRRGGGLRRNEPG